MTIRRYEGAPPPVARKPAVKKAVRRPAVPRSARRYEGTRPVAQRPVARKPPTVAANDSRKAPNIRPGSLPILKARGRAAAAAAQRTRQGASGNDTRKSSMPGSQWGRQAMFIPTAKLDASQVVDLRQAPRPPGRATGRAIGKAVRYEAAMRAWRKKAAAVDRRKPTARVGKSRAI